MCEYVCVVFLRLLYHILQSPTPVRYNTVASYSMICNRWSVCVSVAHQQHSVAFIIDLNFMCVAFELVAIDPQFSMCSSTARPS